MSFITFQNSESTPLYGRLYNWYAIDGLAPAGWHVPTQTEITTMRTYLGGITLSLPKIKSSSLDYWLEGYNGTNESGFTALGSGTRSSSGYEQLKETCCLWTTTDGSFVDTKKAYLIGIIYAIIDYGIKAGGSIRLIRDDLTGYVDGETLTDPDGNVYDTVQIGTQVWLKQNYASTKLANGTPIPNVTDDIAWAALITGAYCNYDNNESYVFETISNDIYLTFPTLESTPLYGRLYNWYVIDPSNSISLAPAGWHVPSSDDYDVLSNSLGGAIISGGKLKEIGTTHWAEPNYNATDEVGFKALPNGLISGTSGAFGLLGDYFYVWTTLEFDSTRARIKLISYDDESLASISTANKKTGAGIRLVRDNSIGYTLSETITDLDDNGYDTVLIGSQVWTKQNWACTKLSDGTPIPNVTNASSWISLTTGAYCNYDNDESYVFETFSSDVYLTLPTLESTPLHGRLYNWYAIDGLAPNGWHVPTQTEFNTMYLIVGDGDPSEVAMKLREVGDRTWDISILNGTDEYGFSGVGSGGRDYLGLFDGGISPYYVIRHGSYMWTSTENNADYARVTYYSSGDPEIYNISANNVLTDKNAGYSIRLVRDNSIGYTLGETLTDPDGNIYDTVQIGTQVWLKQNYASTKLANGTPVSNVIDASSWTALTTGAYCNYDNNESYVFAPNYY
jgi:uncharacterized protein (TIGR02145 family)